MDGHTARTEVSILRVVAALTVLMLAVAACTSRTSETTSVPTTANPVDETTTTSEPPAEDFTYNIGLLKDLTTDNFWAYLGSEFTENNGYVLGDSHPALFTIAYPNILLVPQLAQSEPNEPVQDGEVWVVEQAIRPGVQWSDGEEVTANDLVFTYETVKEFQLGEKWAEYFGLHSEAVVDDPTTGNTDESRPAREGITSITALDDYTVRIEFSAQPGLSVWQNGVGLGPFMPEHFWADRVAEVRAGEDPEAALYQLGGQGEPSALNLIYADRQPGVSVQVVLNPDAYYAGTTYSFYADGSFRQTNEVRGFDEVYNGSGEGEITVQWTRGPYVKNVHYLIYPDENAAVLALRNGEIDLILSGPGLQPGLKDQITGSSDLNLIANPSNHFRYLAFNMRKSPFSYAGFRRAIGCVTDKEFIEALLEGSALSTYGLVPTANTFWANPEVEELCKGLTTEERFDRGIELLEADGFAWAVEPEWDPDNQKLKDGTGTGLTDPAGIPVPELDLLTYGEEFDPLRATYGLWIAEWASNLGISVDANLTGLRSIVDRAFALGADALDWDMYILGWGLREPALPAFHESLFASYQDSAEGGFNTSGYASDRVDELMAELLAAVDVETARAAVQELDRVIVEDAPYVILFSTPILEGHRNTLTFPFTKTLEGLQKLNGMPADIRKTG